MSDRTRRWCTVHDCEMAGKDFCYRMLNHLRGETVFGVQTIGDRMNDIEPDECKQIMVQLIP